MLKIGDIAPEISLKDQNGQEFSLAKQRGRIVVVFFYPQDDTPGCTLEACGIRDGYSQLLAKNALIIGISPDDSASHRQFISKYQLPFDLLSDPDHRLMEQYDAWGEKNLYGKMTIGVKRSSFVVDEDGRIRAIIKRVDTAAPAAQILKHLG